MILAWASRFTMAGTARSDLCCWKEVVTNQTKTETNHELHILEFAWD